jgi:hypothetical protein
MARKLRMATENSNRLSLTEFFEEYNYTLFDILKTTGWAAEPGPALCSSGCVTALYDRCQHGCPSVLLTMLQYGFEWGEHAWDNVSEMK